MTESSEPSSIAERIENALSIAVLALMSVLPLAEIATREWFGGGIPGSFPIVQHLTLWIAFLGAALAARSDRLLALSTAQFLPKSWTGRVRIFTSAIAVAITGSLIWASSDLVSVDLEFGDEVAWGIPVWFAECVMPLGFAAITGRLIFRGASTLTGRLLIALGLLIPLAFNAVENPFDAGLVLPASLIIVAATALGLPIYCALGGAAALLFWEEGTPISAVPGETYRLSTSPMLPAIPLFTLGGYILAEGGSGKRLMRFFEAWVGWLPGGLAIVVTVVLAFFTPLTGASGITILSMGGLLLPMMVKAGYPERTSVGLVTASGSIGLLFVPSLPVILYAFYAEQPIERLFVGGLIPGCILVLAVGGWAAYRGWSSGAEQKPFAMNEAWSALWAAKWEILLPVVVLGGIFGGYATLVEAAALTVLYGLIVECLIFKDLRIFGDLPRVCRKRHARRRLHDYPGRRSGLHELPRHRASAVASTGVGASEYRLEDSLPSGSECFSDRGRRADGYLLRHPRDCAADYADGRRLRYRPSPPRDHLPREHGTGLSDAAHGREPVPVVLPLRPTSDDRLPLDVPLRGDPVHRGAPHYLRTLAHAVARPLHRRVAS